MRKKCLVRGLLMCLALLGHVQLAQAQGSGIGSGTGIGSGGGIGAGGAGGIGGGSSGAAGKGIATLGSTTGGAGGGRAGTAGTAIPATSDPFRTTYANPYAIGLSGVTTAFTNTTGTGGSNVVSGIGFGQPAYAATTVTSQGIGIQSQSINSESWNTLGMRRAPAYITVLGDDVPFVSHVPAELHNALRTSLEQSSILKDKKGVILTVNGTTVFLKGQVASERERRVLEGMVRMTPGVRDVVNELVPKQ